MRAALLCAAWAAVGGQTPGEFFYKLRDKDVDATPTEDPRLGGFGAPGDVRQEATNALNWGEHDIEAVRLTSRRLGHGFDASPDKPRPRARAFHATGVIEDKFFVFGGVGKDATDGGPLLLNDLHFYDQQRGGWSGELKRMSCCRDGAPFDALGIRPSPRAHVGSAVIGTKLWIYGGIGDASGVENDVLGTARNALSTSNRTLGDLHFYDDESATWSGHVAAAGAKPAPRSSAAMAAYGDLLILFGGFDGDGAARNDLHLFNTTSRAWRAAPPPLYGLLPAPRGHAPFAASYDSGKRPAYGGFVDDVLYVFGGSSRAVDAGVSHRQAAMALSEDTWMVNAAQLASTVPLLNWTRLADKGAKLAMGEDREGAARCAHELHSPREGVVYIIAGLDADGRAVDQHAALKVGENVWEDVTYQTRPARHARYGASSAATGPNDRFASNHAARLAEAGRDDRLFRFGGYDQRHEVTDHFEVFVPDIHRKIPDVYPNSDRTVAEDLDTGLAAYHALTVSYPHSPYGLG